MLPLRIVQPQRGFSLVELMVALVISLLLLAGIAGVFVRTSDSNREMARAAQQIENGRYAASALSDDVHLAGFFGNLFMLPAPALAPDPCLTTLAALQDGLGFPIQGFDAPGATPLACLPAEDFVPGTDVLVVRRAATAIVGGAIPAVAGEAYIQSTGPAQQILFGAAPGTLTKKDGTPEDKRKYHVHIYFVSPCSAQSCAGGPDTVPTLKRLELTAVGGALGFRVVPIAEGIENMQVEYGIDDAPATVNPLTGQLGNSVTAQIGDSAPDRYETAPAATEWPNVVVVRIHLLARNPEPSRGYVDTKTYDLGLAGTVTPGLNFRRHVYTTTIRVVNQGNRREA